MSDSTISEIAILPEMTAGEGPKTPSHPIEPRYHYFDWEIGKDRYQIHTTESASGGMGKVYKGIDSKTESEVAIKIVNPLSGYPHLPELEAITQGRLFHPNIVFVHNYLEIPTTEALTQALELPAHTQTLHVIVSEWLDPKTNPTLKDRLKNNPPSIKEASSLLSQLASAVDYMADNKVFHHDLKPSNIILQGGKTPKITDFGLSWINSDDSNTLIGTPAYMSPETALGNMSQADLRSETFSLASIAYEMLTGVSPFNADTPLSSALAVLDAANLSLPKTHSNLTDQQVHNLTQVFRNAWSKEKDDRYQTATDLSKAINKALSIEN